MSTFKLNGDFDKVSAELKKTFEKQEARFNASLETLFKPSPSADPAAPAGTHASAEWSSKEVRSRALNSEGNDSARDRLRNSIRSR